MVKRKKRLSRGIESIERQIEVHEEKKEHAEEEGNIERVEYYEKEIERLRDTQKRKEEQLDKE